MKLRQIVLSGGLAAGLLPSFAAVAGSPPAEASVPAGELKPVEVLAPAVRFDVGRACPALRDNLQAALAPAWGRIGVVGTARVDFRVENHRITRVSAMGSASDYRPYIRKAVAGVACDAGATASQDFRFLLVVHAPDEVPASSRFAALEIE